MRASTFTKITTLVAAVVATISVVVVVNAASADRPESRISVNVTAKGKGTVKGNPAPGKAFTISGDVSGLAPGAAMPLHINIHNPNQQAISVTEVTVTVRSRGVGCQASLVDVESWGSAFTVPGRSTRTRTVEATLDPDAGDNCKNVTFDLRYSGKAEQL